MEFSYDRGKGECAWPKSEMASCEDKTRLVFNYQACPNVHGSEMMSELKLLRARLANGGRCT
jgi:hypothetical protein